jgi:hypothetical protein
MTVYYSNTARQTLGARRLAQGKDFGKRRLNDHQLKAGGFKSFRRT